MTVNHGSLQLALPGRREHTPVTFLPITLRSRATSWISEQLGAFGCKCIQLNGFTASGMPNLPKSKFSTDLYHLFQSTDKIFFMDESTDFILLGSAITPPPPLYFGTFFGYYPPPPDFSEFRLGNPAASVPHALFHHANDTAAAQPMAAVVVWCYHTTMWLCLIQALGNFLQCHMLNLMFQVFFISYDAFAYRLFALRFS